MLAGYTIHDLIFKKPAKTSRNTLTQKRLYLLEIRQEDGLMGYGEISPFEGLSLDSVPGFLQKLDATVASFNEGKRGEELDLALWPSIRFGFEMALLDLKNGGIREFFKGPFASGKQAIPINGLIWMDSPEGMLKQVEEKIAQGFRCIKMKIGALDFDQECRMLELIRKKYSAFQIELRVDANGAFPLDDALMLLKDLNRFELHSIEQPIKQGNWGEMGRLCSLSPLPIALDEELLEVNPDTSGMRMMQEIKPQYLILKPGLLGGFEQSTKWIDLARKTATPWWITSALESNLGLAAIAQFTAGFQNPLPQGLGTGQLYRGNFLSPLRIEAGHLDQNGPDQWNLNLSLTE